MKCYEVLQKSSVPCGMCNNDRLCAGKFVEWRYYNPVIDKYEEVSGDTFDLGNATEEEWQDLLHEIFAAMLGGF